MAIPLPVLVAVASLFSCLALGVPVWISLGAGAALGIFVAHIPLAIVADDLYATFGSFILLAIPLYILAGNMMTAARLTDDIIEVAQRLLGRLKGALVHINIWTGVAFAGVSGAAVADAAAIGNVLIPVMKKQGYSPAYSGAVTAAASAIGPIIPPSLVVIIYASVVDSSVAQLFAAGFVPGILIALGLSAVAAIFAARRDQPRGSVDRARPVVGVVLRASPSLLMPFIVLGSIFFGLFTPTEAAGAACAYGLLVWIFYKRNFSLRLLWKALYDTAVTTTSILLIVAMAKAFAWLLTIYGIPQLLGQSITMGIADKTVYLFLVVGICLIVGTFLDLAVGIIILAPILVPVGIKLGVDPIQMAMVLMISLIVGLLTPPVGMAVFTVASVGGVPSSEVFRAVLPFVAVEVLVLVLVILCPQLSTALPHWLGL